MEKKRSPQNIQLELILKQDALQFGCVKRAEANRTLSQVAGGYEMKVGASRIKMRKLIKEEDSIPLSGASETSFRVQFSDRFTKKSV